MSTEMDLRERIRELEGQLDHAWDRWNGLRRWAEEQRRVATFPGIQRQFEQMLQAIEAMRPPTPQQPSPPPASPLLDALPRRQGDGLPVEAGAAEGEHWEPKIGMRVVAMDGGRKGEVVGHNESSFPWLVRFDDNGRTWRFSTLGLLPEPAPAEEALAQGEKAEPASPVLPGGHGPTEALRAELIAALRLPGAHGPAEYALCKVARRLELMAPGYKDETASNEIEE